MGLCDFAPAVEVGHNHIKDADLKKLIMQFQIKLLIRTLLKVLVMMITQKLVGTKCLRIAMLAKLTLTIL